MKEYMICVTLLKEMKRRRKISFESEQSMKAGFVTF